MITCNRCGNMSPASAVNCQTCGAPLVSKIEAGFGPARTFQEQPELPAWLESLRAGERSAAPADNPANFSPADLIEEGSLPSWMRSGRPETGASGAYPRLRPSSAPGPNTDDSKGINAKSLIDEQSLPSWMQEGAQQGGSLPQGGIPAASLLQQGAAPDWMKSLQAQQFSASNPALPTVQPMAPPQSAFPVSPSSPPMGRSPGRPAQGFSAGDLLDKQSLPSWMKEEKGSSAQLPDQSASGGISPSSLLDADAIPPWLRESAQQEQRSAGLPPTPANQSWPSATPPMSGGPLQQSPVWQPQATNNAPAQGGGLAASSFIDPNALPPWLRSGSEQAPGVSPQQAAFNQRAGYGAPPRVENMRVPSRPRSELNANENNEAAANVFASMLGVASATPSFPTTPPVQGYEMQGRPMPPSMQNIPSPPNMPGQVASAPLGYNPSQGLQGPPQAQNYSQGPIPNNSAYQLGSQGQGGYPLGNQQAGGQPQYSMGGPGMLPPSNPMGASGTMPGAGQNATGKPAKKGFLDIIRDWFR